MSADVDGQLKDAPSKKIGHVSFGRKAALVVYEDVQIAHRPLVPVSPNWHQKVEDSKLVTYTPWQKWRLEIGLAKGLASRRT
jgi:hypothetical protein